MIKHVNVFEASAIQEDRFKQPDFDYSVDFSCEFSNGRFIVYAENLSGVKLEDLKQRYTWLREEDREYADPIIQEV
jgi:hypothetical protein